VPTQKQTKELKPTPQVTDARTLIRPLRPFPGPHDFSYFMPLPVVVNMGRRNHTAVRVVLDFVQLVREIGPVVVINHGKRGNYLFVLVDRLRNQALANQVSDCLRTVLITTLGDQSVELSKQLFFEGNPGSG
jgi:hypothetical protein